MKRIITISKKNREDYMAYYAKKIQPMNPFGRRTRIRRNDIEFYQTKSQRKYQKNQAIQKTEDVNPIEFYSPKWKIFISDVGDILLKNRYFGFQQR